MVVIATHHPRSRFERRMQRRRERQQRRARDRKQPFPSLRRPLDHRTTRRHLRRQWSYYVVHCLAYRPDVVD